MKYLFLFIFISCSLSVFGKEKHKDHGLENEQIITFGKNVINQKVVRTSKPFSVNKNVVKPGISFTYFVNPPKHFTHPKIIRIQCSDNLSTLDGNPMSKSMRGRLVGSSLIEREQNAYIALLLGDAVNPNLYIEVKCGIVISTYTQETVMELTEDPELKKPIMISGRSYVFVIQVPGGFERPFSILVKSSFGKHLIVNSNHTSLEFHAKAWGNGDPNVILSGDISARIYDDSGKIGYVKKLYSIEEPTEDQLNEIPMEKPPEWYEIAAQAAWDATKSTVKATGEVMNATGTVMQAVAAAEAKNGYLQNVQQYKPPSGSSGTKYKFPPLKKPNYATSQKTKKSKTFSISVTCTHPRNLTPSYGGAQLGSFTVTYTQSKKYSMLFPIKCAPLNYSKIITRKLYIENSRSNMAKIKTINTKFDNIYADYANNKVWERYNKAKTQTRTWQQIPRSSFGPFIISGY